MRRFITVQDFLKEKSVYGFGSEENLILILSKTFYKKNHMYNNNC